MQARRAQHTQMEAGTHTRAGIRASTCSAHNIRNINMCTRTQALHTTHMREGGVFTRTDASTNTDVGIVKDTVSYTHKSNLAPRWRQSGS